MSDYDLDEEDYDLDEFDEEDWECSACGCPLDPAGFCVVCDVIPDDWWEEYYEGTPEDETPDWDDESNNLSQYGDIPF